MAFNLGPRTVCEISPTQGQYIEPNFTMTVFGSAASIPSCHLRIRKDFAKRYWF